ncbi:MAG: hypothetical protein GY819_16910 [Planctomycetaceae bacterium]|nr:hypothetical protein [Planctomycetaceae bacterium]MDG1806275.1 hypothetical protein [Pirellulaceae bacterium]MDG2103206.1 hypothetical protein [Pirellulaceae bacterium]
MVILFAFVDTSNVTPLGDKRWVKSTVKKFNWESTIRPGGPQRIHPLPKSQIKAAGIL